MLDKLKSMLYVLEKRIKNWTPVRGSICVGIGNGSSVPSTGYKIKTVVPYSGTITGWRIFAGPDETGSAVIDIAKSTYDDYPPTKDDSITGTNPPALDNQSKASSGDVSDWTTEVTAGDILFWYLDSVDTLREITVVLNITKTS